MSHGQSPTKSARNGIFAIPLLAFFLFYGVVLGVVLPSPDEPPEEPPELLSPPEVSVCDLLSVMVPSTVGLTLPSLVEPSLVLPEDVCTLHTVFNASSRDQIWSVFCLRRTTDDEYRRHTIFSWAILSGDLTGGRADV